MIKKISGVSRDLKTVLQKIQSCNLETSSMPEVLQQYYYHKYKKSLLLQFVCPKHNGIKHKQKSTQPQML